MSTESRSEHESRVLLVAPTSRDGESTHSLLTESGLACVTCDGLIELSHAVRAGAGVVLLTEGDLATPGIEDLLVTFAEQPPWSDLAVVLLTHGEGVSPAAARVVQSIHNVILWERPASNRSVVSAVQFALRGRERQYQMQAQIEATQRAEAALKEACCRQDEFLATLSHELRNPLASIRNSLHLLRLSGDLSPSLEPVRDIMERQVDQMVRQVDDLLNASHSAGGKIETHGDGSQNGSEVVALSPRAGPRRRSVPETAGDADQAPVPRRRILIVDDTRATGYILVKLLEALGQQVRLVNNAAAALECVRSDRPDLVISDIAMPIVDGYELARQLRAEPGLEDLPLVALTGYGQDCDKRRAEEAGFDYHLVKPVSVETLYDLLATLAASPKAELSE